jgi:hypothetical protein
MLLSTMSLRRKKKRRILSPTTLRIVMRRYADNLSASIRRVLKAEGEVQTVNVRAK